MKHQSFLLTLFMMVSCVVPNKAYSTIAKSPDIIGYDFESEPKRFKDAACTLNTQQTRDIGRTFQKKVNRSSKKNHRDPFVVQLASLPDEIKLHIIDYFDFFKERSLFLRDKKNTLAFSKGFRNTFGKIVFTLIKQDENILDCLFLTDIANQNEVISFKSLKKRSYDPFLKEISDVHFTTITLAHIDEDNLSYVKDVLTRKEIIKFIVSHSEKSFFSVSFKDVNLDERKFDSLLHAFSNIIRHQRRINLYSNTFLSNQVLSAKQTLTFLTKFFSTPQYTLGFVGTVNIQGDMKNVEMLKSNLSLFLRDPEKKNLTNFLVDFLLKEEL